MTMVFACWRTSPHGFRGASTTHWASSRSWGGLRPVSPTDLTIHEAQGPLRSTWQGRVTPIWRWPR